MQAILALQLWCIVFALVVSGFAFTGNPYPHNIERLTGSNKLPMIINTLTIIASAISAFELWQQAKGGGMGGGGMGDGSFA